MRTPEEVAHEIATLSAMKPNVRQITAFGDDNHEAIDLQIDVLRELTDRECLDEDLDEGEIDDNAYSAAQCALDWLDGDTDDTPSSIWKPLLTA